ncbi:MAG: NAD(P)H-dependent oxidoreductase [Verrucomicrobia bacterium]|jgi:putative NADPH-quinone reductase|nr:NAD(P)H-dependent oxidoreductase [Verrucomicrobiota bacterium]OQC62600.1 MAG: hypothetical protein BWX48_03668 [Verrucomicrobia bacterium ADurb.Bin006]MDI9380589.1 NAD(P)H-dependent oxidoreductase [Verrucomicrobiota bacterium]NMD21126.1 flavodoxin family protein [Verrucomicrobiota bacterium]HOA59814.1 NAD(P)H-dependent oxidoreductase [Verrucomicrobiota bacterium]
MTISIILAHPTPGSFNHAIAETVRAVATNRGHTVHWHDLYAEGFDPVLPSSELPKDAPLDARIAEQIDEIVTIDGIAIVHPNYWSRPPAILCGWVDRVLRAGRAYQFVPDGKGGGKAQGLLKARWGMVFNTANTPQEIEEKVLGDPLEVHWRKVVFGLCGITDVVRCVFSPVIVSTDDQRRAWLDEVRAVAEKHLP